MAVTYQLLTSDEQDEVLAQTLLANERDHFCHTKNAERYAAMLATLPVHLDKDDPALNEVEKARAKFTAHIVTLIATETAAIANVEGILLETRKQINPAKAAAAHTRNVTKGRV